jgi:hypothetical protein
VTETNVFRFSQPRTFSADRGFLRKGARVLLAQAVEAELAASLAGHADKLTDDGRQRLVRHTWRAAPQSSGLHRGAASAESSPGKSKFESDLPGWEDSNFNVTQAGCSGARAVRAIRRLRSGADPAPTEKIILPRDRGRLADPLNSKLRDMSKR